MSGYNKLLCPPMGKPIIVLTEEQPNQTYSILEELSSSDVLEDNGSSIYYIPSDYKSIPPPPRPNIISRGSTSTNSTINQHRGRIVTVCGGSPSSLTSVVIPSVAGEEEESNFLISPPSYSPSSTCVSQSISTPVVTPKLGSDSVTLAHDTLSSSTLHVLENGSITYLGSTTTNLPQVINLDNLHSTNNNTLSIQTNTNGNLVLYLHEEKNEMSNNTTTFSTHESYILVQIDSEGNTILVPTSSINDDEGMETIRNEDNNELGSVVMDNNERPTGPYRYVLSDNEDETTNTQQQTELVETHINPYLNILASSHTNNNNSTINYKQQNNSNNINIDLDTSCCLAATTTPSSTPPVLLLLPPPEHTFTPVVMTGTPILTQVPPPTDDIHHDELHPASSSATSPTTPQLIKSIKSRSSPVLLLQDQQSYSSNRPVQEESVVPVLLLDGFSQTSTGTYSCSSCSKETKSQVAMINHLNRNHRGTMPFVCTICKDGFQYMYSLRAHQKSYHHQPVPTISSVSVPVISHPTNPSELSPIKTLQPGIRCPDCLFSTFPTHLHLTEHLDNVHTKCTTDTTTTMVSRKSKEPKKKRRKHNETDVQYSADTTGCRICGKIFSNPVDLKSHTLQWHSTTTLPTVPCTQSDFVTVLYDTSGSSNTRESRPRKVKVVPIAELSSPKLLTIEPIITEHVHSPPRTTRRRQGRLRRPEPPSSVCEQVERDFVSIFQKVQQNHNFKNNNNTKKHNKKM